MSRKVIITLAAAATVAVASLASTTSYARGFGGGHFGSGHAFARGGAVRGPVRPIGRGFVRARGPSHLTISHRPGRLCLLGHPCHPNPPVWVWHHHHHWHWVFRFGHWINVDDVAVETPVDVAPAAVSVPGPCTCLTKTYTPTGLVVFADVCTKESASAPATEDTSDASQAPTTQVPATATPIAEVPTTPNYAGRTYQQYLAANPQAAQPQASSQPAQPSPSAPQQN
jgi:hypothetical protein